MATRGNRAPVYIASVIDPPLITQVCVEGTPVLTLDYHPRHMLGNNYNGNIISIL